MRWMIACMCWLLLPLPVAAKCHVNAALSFLCKEPSDTRNVLAPWGPLDDFFPPVGVDHAEQVHWVVEREPAPQHFHLPKLRLGNGFSVGYRRRDLTVSRDCWQVSFRAFSKISVFCRSSF